MALPGLLKAARKPHSAGDRSNDQGIAISDAELEWLNRFHSSVRNQFTHFEPMGWSLEVSGIPEIAMLVARIVSEITDTGWAFRHKSGMDFGAKGEPRSARSHGRKYELVGALALRGDGALRTHRLGGYLTR